MNIPIDYFYNYGQVELRDEIKQDILLGMLTDKRSMYYDRQYGAGVYDFENQPSGVLGDVVMRYNIAMYMARRNSVVGNGEGITRDHRAITSQSAITVDTLRDNNGIRNMLDVEMSYMNMFDLQAKEVASIKIDGR